MPMRLQIELTHAREIEMILTITYHVCLYDCMIRRFNMICGVFWSSRFDAMKSSSFPALAQCSFPPLVPAQLSLQSFKKLVETFRTPTEGVRQTDGAK